MRHDLPDTVSGLEDRIQYLEWVAESCSRKVYEQDVKPELRAARKKLDRLKGEQIAAEAAAAEPKPMKQAA